MLVQLGLQPLARRLIDGFGTPFEAGLGAIDTAHLQSGTIMHVFWIFN